jgi:hypothetical protein
MRTKAYMFGEQGSVFENLPATELNSAIATLPVAVEKDVFVERDGIAQKESNFKAIVVGREVVNIPSKRYTIVQHKDAFKPIVEGLTIAGDEQQREHFRFSMWHSSRKAWLNLFVGDVVEKGFGKIEYGFRVLNSFDGTTAVKYNLISKHKGEDTTYVALVGYRQLCSNGMVIKVPITEADTVKEEMITLQGKIQQLANFDLSIMHTSNADEKLGKIQFVVEALMLMKNPLKRFINKAKAWKIEDEAMLRRIVKAHIGERMKDRILQQYRAEEQDLWGLFNAITYVASHEHELSDGTRNSLLDKSANLLVEVLERNNIGKIEEASG